MVSLDEFFSKQPIYPFQGVIPSLQKRRGPDGVRLIQKFLLRSMLFLNCLVFIVFTHM